MCMLLAAAENRPIHVRQLAHQLDEHGVEEFLEATGVIADGVQSIDESRFVVAAACTKGHVFTVAVPSALPINAPACGQDVEDAWCAYRSHPATWRLGDIIVGDHRWGCGYDWHTESPMPMYLELVERRPGTSFHVPGRLPSGGLTFYSWEVDPLTAFEAFRDLRWRGFRLAPPSGGEAAPAPLPGLQGTTGGSGVDAAGRKLLRGPSIFGSPAPDADGPIPASKEKRPHANDRRRCSRSRSNGKLSQPPAEISEGGPASASAAGSASAGFFGATSAERAWLQAQRKAAQAATEMQGAAASHTEDASVCDDDWLPVSDAAQNSDRASRQLQGTLKHTGAKLRKYEVKFALARDDNSNEVDGIDFSVKAGMDKIECDLKEKLADCDIGDNIPQPTSKNVYGWKYLQSKSKGWQPDGGIKLTIDFSDMYFQAQLSSESRPRFPTRC